jgi:hypothetical protein
MNLFYTIKQTLEQLSEDEVLRSMGYNNLQKGHLTLRQFLDTGDIYLWLKKGEYDLKYNSEQFLEKLIEALNLTSIGKDELKQCNRRLDAIRAMRNTPYIYIDTHFKRKGETILSLGFMEGRRNIYIDKELLVFKNQSEVFALIGDIVKKHYLESEGKLPLWGKIYNYVYHHTDGSKYVFDTNGVLLHNQDEISESRAELKIGNQNIVGMRNE